MKLVAQVIAAVAFGLAVGFAVAGSPVTAGTMTFTGVVWICIWAQEEF